jgi:hypothetical protein
MVVRKVVSAEAEATGEEAFSQARRARLQAVVKVLVLEAQCSSTVAPL